MDETKIHDADAPAVTPTPEGRSEAADGAGSGAGVATQTHLHAAATPEATQAYLGPAPGSGTLAAGTLLGKYRVTGLLVIATEVVCVMPARASDKSVSSRNMPPLG